MSLKSVVTLPTTLVAAVAGFVLLLSAAAPSSRAAANPQVPQELLARSQQAGRVRVIVELALPSGHAPEASLPTTAAVFAQRQAIGARAAQVLSRLPAGSHRTIHQYQTIPYLALEVTPAGLSALAQTRRPAVGGRGRRPRHAGGLNQRAGGPARRGK